MSDYNPYDSAYHEPIATNVDLGAVTFVSHPLKRPELVGLLACVVVFAPSTMIGSVVQLAGLVGMSMAMFPFWERRMRVTSGAVFLEASLLARVTSREVIALETVERVDVVDRWLWPTLRLQLSRGESRQIRLGSPEDHRVVGSWLNDHLASVALVQDPECEIPMAIRNLGCVRYQLHDRS